MLSKHAGQPVMPAAFLVFAAASVALAQSGSVAVAVSDLDHTLVKDATVRATNAATGTVTRLVGSPNGVYTLQLPPGSYDLSIPMPCCLYGPWSKNGVRVEAGRTLRLDIVLPWGANLGTAGDDPIRLLTELRENSAAAAGPAPRSASGTPDLTGMWLSAIADDLDAPPLQAWAADLQRKRSVIDGSKDYPGGFCLPASAAPVTRGFAYKIIQAPTEIVMLNENDTPGHRQIYLDGRPHPSNAEPTWLGYSTAHWEGETLVVDTTNFNDRAWLNITGVPHTEKLHVIERYHRVDFGHMEVDVEMEDSLAFTKPWKRQFPAALARPGEDILEYICENNRDTIHYR